MKHSNYWFETYPTKTNFGVGFVKNVDVLVIGGGLAGITTLFQLVRGGVTNSYLLEENTIGYHASGRSNGQLMLRGQHTFTEALDLFGADIANEYLAFCASNLRKFSTALVRSKIDIDLVQGGGLHIATTPDELAALKREVAFINSQYGTTGVGAIFLSENDIKNILPSCGFLGAMYVPSENILNPYKLIHGIKDIIESNGSRILTNSCVEKIERNVDGTFNIAIRHKGVIIANKIVYCTSAYTPHLLPELKDSLIPFRGQIIATDFLPKQILQALPTMSISCNKGQDYFRLHEGRLLVGGQRQNIRGNQEGIIYDGEISQTVFKRQRDFLQQHLPYISPKFTHAWAGVMSQTSDGMPLVGELLGRKNEFIMAGFGEYGLSHIYMASLIIRDKIVKGTSTLPGTKLFDPTR